MILKILLPINFAKITVHKINTPVLINVFSIGGIIYNIHKMFLIDEILVSSAVLEKKFVCNLSKCKGACCWEGDFGAPLEDAEKDTIMNNLPTIKPLLTEDARRLVDEQKIFEKHPDRNSWVTALHEDGRCIFLAEDRDGIARCAFEIAWENGISNFRKPVSCHLYPLRINQFSNSTIAINYDSWDICSPACLLGEELSIPVFRFVKEAIVRKFGLKFYDEIERFYQDLFPQEDLKS